MSGRTLLEVIVQSVVDAIEATNGGADRLEVVREIRAGGLTPAIDLVRRIMEATPLPLRVMVRENGGFRTDPDELARMRDAARAFQELQVDGLVVGFADAGRVLLEPTAYVLSAAPVLAATFHRAFDTLDDPAGSISAIAALTRCDRILTSGGDGAPDERSRRLQQLVERAANRLVILAGGGVDAACIIPFKRAGISEFHVGGAAREHAGPEGPVSAKRVRTLRELLDSDDNQGS